MDNCLDLLLTNIVDRATNIEITSSDKVGVLSYHDAITFNLDFSSRIPNDNRQIKFNFERADFMGLRKALQDDPSENYLDEDSIIKDDWAAWKSVLFSKLNCYIPKLKLRKFVTSPWMDGEVNHAIRKKNSLFKKAKQKVNDCLWERFREKRKEVKYLTRSKRMAFLQGISDSRFSDPKRFWGYFNRLTKRSSIPEAVELNALSYFDSKHKASAFNTYFSSVFNTYTSIPTSLPTSP